MSRFEDSSGRGACGVLPILKSRRGSTGGVFFVADGAGGSAEVLLGRFELIPQGMVFAGRLRGREVQVSEFLFLLVLLTISLKDIFGTGLKVNFN